MKLKWACGPCASVVSSPAASACFVKHDLKKKNFFPQILLLRLGSSMMLHSPPPPRGSRMLFWGCLESRKKIWGRVRLSSWECLETKMAQDQSNPPVKTHVNLCTWNLHHKKKNGGSKKKITGGFQKKIVGGRKEKFLGVEKNVWRVKEKGGSKKRLWGVKKSWTLSPYIIKKHL